MANIVKSLGNSMQKDRERERQDEEALKGNIDFATALGTSESNEWLTGKLRPAQQAIMDKTASEQSDRTAEYYTEAGLRGTKQEQSQETQNQISQAILKDVWLNNAWQKAFESFGYANKYIQELIALNEERKNESMQIFQGLMGGIGGLVGMFGGKGGK